MFIIEDEINSTVSMNNDTEVTTLQANENIDITKGNILVIKRHLLILTVYLNFQSIFQKRNVNY